jgi:hypothetical protein
MYILLNLPLPSFFRLLFILHFQFDCINLKMFFYLVDTLLHNCHFDRLACFGSNNHLFILVDPHLHPREAHLDLYLFFENLIPIFGHL